MDFRKQLRRHPTHRPALRRMRPRRDFFDTVAPLSDDEEKEFAALQANMAMRLVMQKMLPPALPVPAAQKHEHLPRFDARSGCADSAGSGGWSPAALTTIGLLAAAGLWALVCGLALVF